MKNLLIALITLAFPLSACAELIVQDVAKALSPEAVGSDIQKMKAEMRYTIAQNQRAKQTNHFCVVVYQQKDGAINNLWFWQETGQVFLSGLYTRDLPANYSPGDLLLNKGYAIASAPTRADVQKCIEAGNVSCNGTGFTKEDLEETQADCAKNGTTYTIKPFKPEQE